MENEYVRARIENANGDELEGGYYEDMVALEASAREYDFPIRVVLLD